MKRRTFVNFLFICTLLFFPSAKMLFAETFFNGYSGAIASIQPTEESLIPDMSMEAFLAGQFDIGGIFQLRTEISIETEDILDYGVFQDTPAIFSIEELSLTTRFRTDSTSHFITLFLGEYESIGSDLFLRRQFGIQSITPKITETWKGISGNAIYPFSGLGGSYVTKFAIPMALGAYIYVNNKDDVMSSSADIRFAGVYRYGAYDFSGGITFPFETQDATGDNVILLIRTVDLHAGFSFIIGKRYTSALFIQAGINRIRMNPNESKDEKVLKLSDLYFFVEPRFVTKKLNFHFSLFNIPVDMAEDLFFISNPLGCNLTVFADNISLGKLNLCIGSHITVSSPDVTLEKINTLSKDNLALQLAPFISSNVFGGTLNIAAKIDILNISNWKESFMFNAGYKVML
ncbi:MAG: hypothetical protein J6B32_05110 [Spirochaetaceae bacterium]|nr:hypothetical protein [Spirochaetaceae bacterium]